MSCLLELRIEPRNRDRLSTVRGNSKQGSLATGEYDGSLLVPSRAESSRGIAHRDKGPVEQVEPFELSLLEEPDVAAVGRPERAAHTQRSGNALRFQSV